MSESADLTYHQRNRDVVLNKAKHYKNNKDRLKEQASEEEKNNKKKIWEEEIS